MLTAQVLLVWKGKRDFSKNSGDPSLRENIKTYSKWGLNSSKKDLNHAFVESLLPLFVLLLLAFLCGGREEAML